MERLKETSAPTLPSSINRLYVVLGDGADFPAQKLDTLISSLLPHLGLTANVYVIAPGLATGMPLVERIQKRMKAFLKTHRFVRYNLHFLHPLPSGDTAGDAEYFFQYYYQPWKRGGLKFDREGYIHQEIPRLSLFAVVAPKDMKQLPFLTNLVGLLAEHLIFPSLYLQEEMVALAEEKGVTGKIKKVYYGSGVSLDPEAIACNTCAQDLVEASCAAYLSGTFPAAAPCDPALFMTAQNGRIYPCLNAFSKGAFIGNAYEEQKPEALIVRCRKTREKECNCFDCRRYLFERFASLSLPESIGEKVALAREFVQTRDLGL